MRYSFVDSADLHLGKYKFGRLNTKTGLDTSLESTLFCLDELVEFAIKNKVNFVRLLGDFSKMMTLTELERSELYKRLYKLSNAEIDVYCLIGNHDDPDSKGSAHNIKSLKVLNLKNVHVIEIPQVIERKDCNLLFIPYIPGREEWIRNYKEQRKKIWSSSKKVIVGLHGNIQGTNYFSELSESDELEDIPRKIFYDDPGILYVGAGHQHRYQVLSKTPMICSTGSLDRVTMEERDDKKGFIYNVVDNGKLKHKFIEVNARKFLQFTIYSKSLPALNFKDAIVKVELDNEKYKFDSYDKEELEFRLKELGAQYVSFKSKTTKTADGKKLTFDKTGISVKSRISMWIEANVENKQKKRVREIMNEVVNETR